MHRNLLTDAVYGPAQQPTHAATNNFFFQKQTWPVMKFFQSENSRLILGADHLNISRASDNPTRMH